MQLKNVTLLDYWPDKRYEIVGTIIVNKSMLENIGTIIFRDLNWKQLEKINYDAIISFKPVRNNDIQYREGVLIKFID